METADAHMWVPWLADLINIISYSDGHITLIESWVFLGASNAYQTQNAELCSWVKICLRLVDYIPSSTNTITLLWVLSTILMISFTFRHIRSSLLHEKNSLPAISLVDRLATDTRWPAYFMGLPRK